jgi:hypothetical protein
MARRRSPPTTPANGVQSWDDSSRRCKRSNASYSGLRCRTGGISPPAPRRTERETPPHSAPIRWPLCPCNEQSLCCTQGLLLSPVATRGNDPTRSLCAPASLQGFHRSYEEARPNAPLGYSRLTVFAACASPLTSEHWFLQFRANACIRFTPLYAGRRLPSIRFPQTFPSETIRLWF